ncbi:MAG: phosphoadenylyl-sulfate reductase [Pseudohongiellaceae bacterium]
MPITNQIADLNREFQDKSPQDILRKALTRVPNIAISFSGAEDVVLIEMASKVLKKLDDQASLSVFTLDTGRLHPETYQFIEKVRDHYGINIAMQHPDAERLSRLVTEKGLFSFYKDGHEECCGIRKIEPLRRQLATVDGWITGQRRDQSPTRTDVPVFELDATFSTDEHTLIKVNPLANWTSAQVWEYIRMFDVPYNALHDRGFVSIGCEPCTRPVGPNQHEREGRWWWEEATRKECGLHLKPIEEVEPGSGH